MTYFKRQRDAINATIESKSLERLAIGKRMEGEGRTMDAEEQRTFDSLTSDIDALRADLKRYEGMEADAATARPVQPLADEKANRPIGPYSHSRSYAEVRDTQSQEKGIGFARVARCIALAHLHHQDPAQIAKSVYPGDDCTLRTVTKAAVPAASTGNAGWAGNLITDGGVGFADFVEFLRPLTLVGQVSGRLRRLPFDTPVLVQGTGGTAKWVKEGTAKPLTQWSYTRTKLAPLKVAAIAAATKETLMRASAAADALLRDELARAIAAAIDTTFIDPAVAPVSDESPGSILNGVAPIAVSDGLSVADIRCDIATFLTAFADENLSVTGSFWVMPERIAIALSLIVNEVGTPAFPGITPNGGTLAGLPVFVTGYASTDSTGSVVALVKGDEIFLGDEEGIQVSMSDQASLIMDDAPNHNSTTPTGTNLVSMFQTNSVAFLCERHINWQRRRAQAVAWARVGWSACQSS